MILIVVPLLEIMKGGFGGDVIIPLYVIGDMKKIKGYILSYMKELKQEFFKNYEII